jgi:sec-independent protein translocase protein TatB
MFDLSWGELMVIGTVALVVIGPKDLPVAIRTVSRFVGQARKLAREFQSGMEQMAREAGVDEMKREVNRIASGDYDEKMKSYIDPDGVLDRPDLSVPEFDSPEYARPLPPSSPPSASASAAEANTAPPPLPAPELAAQPAIPFEGLEKVEKIEPEPVPASGKPV